MQLYSECMYCIVEHHWSLVKDCPDEARKAAFMRDVLRTVAEADESGIAGADGEIAKTLCGAICRAGRLSAPEAQIQRIGDSWMPELRQALASAADPFKMAVWMAMAGNYIDLASSRKWTTRASSACSPRRTKRPWARPVLEELRADVRSARHLVYACDNCGEVVLDRLLMEEMKKENPGLQITALVRGENVLNDVSAEDARAVGLDRVAKIVGNGSNIGGTQMAYLGDEAREAMLDADLIISKGQGNFETLTGAGLNVYYLFLAKCPHYTKWFGMEHMSGQLLHTAR